MRVASSRVREVAIVQGLRRPPVTMASWPAMRSPPRLQVFPLAAPPREANSLIDLGSVRRCPEKERRRQQTFHWR
jgi:hypothetical protein